MQFLITTAFASMLLVFAKSAHALPSPEPDWVPAPIPDPVRRFIINHPTTDSVPACSYGQYQCNGNTIVSEEGMVLHRDIIS